jgi:hypothetical protein
MVPQLRQESFNETLFNALLAANQPYNVIQNYRLTETLKKGRRKESTQKERNSIPTF